MPKFSRSTNGYVVRCGVIFSMLCNARRDKLVRFWVHECEDYSFYVYYCKVHGFAARLANTMMTMEEGTHNRTNRLTRCRCP
jgi:hypothetical protein